MGFFSYFKVILLLSGLVGSLACDPVHEIAPQTSQAAMDCGHDDTHHQEHEKETSCRIHNHASHAHFYVRVIKSMPPVTAFLAPRMVAIEVPLSKNLVNNLLRPPIS